MKIGLLIGLLLGAVLVASCSVPNVPATSTPPVLEVETSTAPTVENAQVYQVAIENGNLMPVDIEINAGDTVEWVNKDTVRYTLQFGSFEERLPMGGMFEYTFTQTGTVRYSAVEIEGDEDDRQEDRDNNLNDLGQEYNPEDSRENNQERELHGTIIVG